MSRTRGMSRGRGGRRGWGEAIPLELPLGMFVHGLAGQTQLGALEQVLAAHDLGFAAGGRRQTTGGRVPVGGKHCRGARGVVRPRRRELDGRESCGCIYPLLHAHRGDGLLDRREERLVWLDMARHGQTWRRVHRDTGDAEPSPDLGRASRQASDLRRGSPKRSVGTSITFNETSPHKKYYP